MTEFEEPSIKLDLMKWNVERLEVANLSLIDRASTLSGFTVLEFGLVAQLLTLNLTKFHRLEKDLLQICIVGLFIALLSFLWSLRSKSEGIRFYNEDLVEKDLSQIISMFTYSDPSESETGNKLKIRLVKRKEPKDFQFNEEALQYLENKRRSRWFRNGIIFLGVAQLCIVVSLISYLNS